MQNLKNRIASRGHRFFPVVTSITCAAVLLLSACATPLKQQQPASQAFPPGTETVAWETLRRNLPDLESSSWFSIPAGGYLHNMKWRRAVTVTPLC